ncbi:AMP-binding protein, partial [Mycobacteroides abscessus subsp. massiliense]
LYPPGLPFVAAFLGCLAAGVVAVPAPLPDGRDKAQHRLAGIIADAGTRVVLTESSVAPLIAGWADALPTPIALIATDAIPVELGREFVPVRSAPSDTAFLQYTSGSTNAPKGVIVTHGNLVHNEQELGARIENDPSFSMLSWLPQFHDMGLIG